MNCLLIVMITYLQLLSKLREGLANYRIVILGIISSTFFGCIWAYYIAQSTDPQAPIGWAFTPIYCFIFGFIVCGILASIRALWFMNDFVDITRLGRIIYVFASLVVCSTFIWLLLMFIGWSYNEISSLQK